MTSSVITLLNALHYGGRVCVQELNLEKNQNTDGYFKRVTKSTLGMLVLISMHFFAKSK